MADLPRAVGFGFILLVTACGVEEERSTGGAPPPLEEVSDALSSVAAPCAGANSADGAFDDAAVMPPGLAAFEWVPSKDAVLAYLEVFTGEKAGPNQLAIWRDDGAAVSQPSAPLATTQVFTTSPINGWQGAALSQPVSVLSGQRYWIVWSASGGEQASATNGASALPQATWQSSIGSVSGGASWSEPDFVNRWKFRAFCGTCTTLRRRGTGVASDAYVSSTSPVITGASPALIAGKLGFSVRQSLVRFDTSLLPPEGIVSLAKMKLQVSSFASGTLDAHRVTAPWDEASVTWSSFAGAYDPVAFASAPLVGSPASAPLLFDITGLAGGWVTGSVPNEGLLLARQVGSTTIHASETPSLANRPALDLCWDEPAPQTCPLSGRPFSGTLCGAQQPCVVHDDEIVSSIPTWGNDTPSLAIDEQCGVHVLYSDSSVVLPGMFAGAHAVRSGPSAWTSTQTPFSLATSGAVALGGSTVLGVAYDGAFGVSASTWDGASWGPGDLSPTPGHFVEAGIAQASGGGPVHLVYFNNNLYNTFFHATYQGSWTVTPIAESSFYRGPYVALSPNDDVQITLWNALAQVYELRWRTPSTPSELVASVPKYDFRTSAIGFAVTGADPQNPQGKPHAFHIERPPWAYLEKLVYSTRVGPGVWTSQVIEQVNPYDLCANTTPWYPSDVCSYSYQTIEPLGSVSTASGSVRVFYNVTTRSGALTASCSPYSCSWNYVPPTVGGTLRMVVIEPSQPVSVVTIPSVSLLLENGHTGSAKLDNDGNIHLAFYDNLTTPEYASIVRYVSLGL